MRLVLPARASAPRAGRFVPLPQWEDYLRALEEQGGSRGWFKVLLRDALRRHPLYHLPVEVVPPVTGRSDTGVPIPINTLGRWLWGVPGYMANAVFSGWGPVPGVWLPVEAPPEAEALLRAASPPPTP